MATPASRTHPIDHPSERLIQDLAGAVEGALWAYGPLRQSNASLGVTAEHGRVTLAGNVRSSVMKAIAGQLAGAVPGVAEVVNTVFADTDLERDVAMALARDPDTELFTDRLTLKCLLGTVYLGGTVTAPQPAAAQATVTHAEALARAVPGVRDVINQVRSVAAVTAQAGAPA